MNYLKWYPYLDSNEKRRFRRPKCFHYTIRACYFEKMVPLPGHDPESPESQSGTLPVELQEGYDKHLAGIGPAFSTWQADVMSHYTTDAYG